MAVRHVEAGNGKSALQLVEPFVYPNSPWTEEMAGIGGRLEELFRDPAEYFPVQGSGAGPGPGTQPDGTEAQTAETAQGQALRFAAALREAEERGRGLGFAAGAALARDEACRRLDAERDRLMAQARSLAEGFAAAQAEYFHRMEAEAVRLALAVAARILRREAQMDRLLLAGAVRVALGQLAESTEVRLRVPACDEATWKQALPRLGGNSARMEVVADPLMEPGECCVETEIGSADLGLWSQLKEIERGFFDRLESHPGSLDAMTTLDAAEPDA